MQGGQSQYVRVPMADGTLVPVPEGIAGDEHDARVLPLTDVFTTAYHAVVGADIAEGDAVLVLGDGAVGLLGLPRGAAARPERPSCWPATTTTASRSGGRWGRRTPSTRATATGWPR